MSLVSLRNVELAFDSPSGPLHILRGITLDVQQGEVVGIAGESGCGKTTLGSTILRLQPPAARLSGDVIVNGADVNQMTWGDVRALRWAVGSVVFQGALHSLNPVQTIGQQIMEPMLIHRTQPNPSLARHSAQELLVQVGVPISRFDAYPHQLSGGQRQRVVVAMAMACQPQLVIADEPTTALDVMVQAQVLAVLLKLVRSHNMSMIFISHDLSALAQVADRIAVMYAGRIVEEGTTSQVLEHPLHPYTRALVDAFPIIGDPRHRFAPASLGGEPPVPGGYGVGCAFAPRCPVSEDQCTQVEPTLQGPMDHRVACFVTGGRR